MSIEFVISSPDDLHQVSGYVCDHLDDGGKPLKIKITGASNRSLSQNSLYHKWMGELSAQIKQKSGQSYSSDDLHEYMKASYCPDKVIKFGKKEVSTKSTARLDKGEMHFYMNQVHAWAINAGFKLTLPIDSEFQKLMEQQNGQTQKV